MEKIDVMFAVGGDAKKKKKWSYFYSILVLVSEICDLKICPIIKRLNEEGKDCILRMKSIIMIIN